MSYSEIINEIDEQVSIMNTIKMRLESKLQDNKINELYNDWQKAKLDFKNDKLQILEVNSIEEVKII